MEGTSSFILHLILLFAFFCLASGQRTVDIEAPAIPAPGYKLYRDGYYKIHTELKTWHEARQICAQEGGYLAIINSEEESELVVKLFLAENPDLNGRCVGYVSIGFHDLYNEGQFLTVFDQPLNSTGFYRWSAGQPDNQTGCEHDPGEDCGTINLDGGLNDQQCSRECPFACEM